MSILEIIKQPWHWAVAGTAIAIIKFTLLFFGKSFGFSSNLRTICAACGAGKHADFFKFEWKSQIWNLVFLIGAILGGFIAQNYLSNNEPVQIASSTIADLQSLNIAKPTSLQPSEFFSVETLFTLKGFVLLAIGGLLIGFGTRYAGGCTSGHAISGLSNLQLPSLIAVIGFFIGGLIMTFLILPLIFS
jgi:uncharacterized protein